MNPWQVEPIAEKQELITAGMVTEDVERRVSERLARGSVGSFVWDSGVRDEDMAFCIREEQRNSTMVLALLAIQTWLRVYEELKVDEARLLRLHFRSDLSPRQPALIAGVLFGEAVLRNLPKAYRKCFDRSKSEDCSFSEKESCFPCRNRPFQRGCQLDGRLGRRSPYLHLQEANCTHSQRRQRRWGPWSWRPQPHIQP